MKFPFLLLFTLMFFQVTYTQENLDEGLYFFSHEVTQEERTSLNITPEKPINFKNKLVLEFDANFRRGDGYYGNIFKIIDEKELNIDLVANLNAEQENFWLVVKDEIIFKYKWADIPKGDYDKWINFKIEINAKTSGLTFSINDYKITKDISEISNIKNVEIIFGKSLYKKFTTTDVCPMTIKNVKIYENGDTPIRHWELGKHTKGNIVYDNIKNQRASVENPRWLIDQHLIWQEKTNFDFNHLLGTATDASKNRIFFIDSEALYIYDILTEQIDTLKYTEESLKCQSNNFIYNPHKDELIAYSIDENFFKTFDFRNLEWSEPNIECNETAYLHHNSLISPIDSTLITFGGYGYYSYQAQLFKISSNPPQFTSSDVSEQIDPRYLSSSGILNPEQFLLFGGYGSPSGKQGVNSQYYFDLYSIDFDDFNIKKLWEVKNDISSPYVPTSSMVIDNNSDSFYTLLYNNANYNTHLKLARIGIKEYSMKVFPDSIPFEFLDVKSDVDFFLNNSNSKLFTLTIIENKANLYSLTYPPLTSEDIYQKTVKSTSFFQKSYWYYILIFIIVIALIHWLINRKKFKEVLSTRTDPSSEYTAELITDKEERKKSAIYLFGGFQVYDKEENDITALFTPTLKQLFMIIFLTTSKNGKGISSIRLTELLWPNKSERNARNNRNVNISKLRILLEKIGDIKLNNENTYWKINLESSVFCDYIFVQDYLLKSHNHNLNEKQTYLLLDILSRGEISPDLQIDWIEDFKNETNNLIIDNLLRTSRTIKDNQLLINISTIVLKYDQLNEEAIEIKCKSLYAQGKIGLAKQTYNEFNDKYFDILDSKYEKLFQEVIGV